MAMTLESAVVTAGAAIPTRHTCDGEDVSPPLRWSGAPAEARSFALVLADPDAPSGTFFHWAIFDIPADQGALVEAVAQKPEVGPVRQGLNDFNRVGYSGPCPPKGDKPHHYRFRLFALKVAKLELREHVKAAEVEARARDQALETADLVAIYGR